MKQYDFELSNSFLLRLNRYFSTIKDFICMKWYWYKARLQSRSIGFEFDLNKSQSNEEKHGITLLEAALLWTVSHHIANANEASEIRQMIIGKLFDRFYTCIFTIRGKRIRLISARRSRIYEEKAYYEKFKTQENNS